jgi:16S rRNA processing protein RimM
MVVLGRVSGVFGVRGWVKVFSETDPMENILTYSPWYLRVRGAWLERRLLEGKVQGKGIVAHIEGYEDRDRAALLTGSRIGVPRERLPELAHDEYYWSDLEGLEVRTLAGAELGFVSHLFDTGANDVMVVRGERERLIPYLWDHVVKRVDLDSGLLVVDWDPDF